MATVTVVFTLNDDDDRDLVRWLATLPRRGKSKAIREALRVQLSQSGVTLGDVYQAVKALERKLDGLAVVAGPITAGDVPDEPPDVAANLDNLGL